MILLNLFIKLSRCKYSIDGERVSINFIIKGNDENLLRTLFANDKIRRLISTQPRIHLQVKDDEGYFGSDFPQGVDELYFRVVGIIKDTERLKQLFDLFTEVLNHLCQIGSAYEDDPRMDLKD